MNQTKPLVSVIIVNWNGEKYLTKCLPSLHKQTYKNIEVLFVDNASQDSSVSYVKKRYPHFKLILNSKNLGYAEGHETAFKKAKGEFVLLLSMDTILDRHAVTNLVNRMLSDTHIGAVQPKLLMYPQVKLIDSIGSFFDLSGILYHFGREKLHTRKKYNVPMEVFAAKGACLLFRKSSLKKTGMFDNNYFAYFEETDLCHRIWLAGYTIMYEPKAIVWHTGGGASKKMVPSYIYFHSYKNRIQTYLKNLSVPYLLRLLPFLFIVYEGATVAYLLKGKPSVAFAIQKSIVWNIMHLPEILKKREHVQKRIRLVTDSSFLPKLTRPVSLSYYYYIFYGLKNYKDL